MKIAYRKNQLRKNHEKSAGKRRDVEIMKEMRERINMNTPNKCVLCKRGL